MPVPGCCPCSVEPVATGERAADTAELGGCGNDAGAGWFCPAQSRVTRRSMWTCTTGAALALAERAHACVGGGVCSRVGSAVLARIPFVLPASVGSVCSVFWCASLLCLPVSQVTERSAYYCNASANQRSGAQLLCSTSPPPPTAHTAGSASRWVLSSLGAHCHLHPQARVRAVWGVPHPCPAALPQCKVSY